MAEPRDRDADLELAMRGIPVEQVNLGAAVIGLHRSAKQARDGWDAAETANHELAARVAQLTRLRRAVVEAAEIGQTIPQHIVVLARGEADDGKDPAAVSLSRRGASKGGKARAEKLTSERRSEIAKKAATARWARVA